VPTLHRFLLTLVAAAMAALGSACGNGDELQPNEDHTPVSYNLLIDDQPVSPPYTFVDGETARVRIKFFNAAGEDLDSEEAGHFARLTFNPITLATAVRLDDHHYQFDVTGGTAGEGTLQVGYGHDDFADETVFDPAPVRVTIPGPGNPP
jgi:hypothetical protein